MSSKARLAAEAQVFSALAEAPDWRLAADGSLRFERTFDSPAAAVGFLVAVAMSAERRGHHPEVTWSYRQVTLRLVTHDVGDVVTDKDLALLADLVALG